ncbi:MAG: hypothetical protein IK066_03525 [Kiritimatiellae bacterium]|nr:hypothetical protein [Kiritimatiellia bacterium]
MKRPKRPFPRLSDKQLANLNDSFPNGEFSAPCWSAKPIVSPAEIRTLLDYFRLVGRTIRHVWTESHDYAQTKDPLESTVYDDLRERLGLSETEAKAGSSIHSFDRRARIARCMEIDEPFVIEFDSRETFEIFVTDAPTYRISMNRIPRRLLENRFDNVNPNVMFAPALGRTISAVDLRTVPEGYDDETVDAILLRLDDGNTLEIQGWFDFLEVALLDRDEKPLREAAEALLPGFFNYEDLHIDRRTGFEAKDSTLWFGQKSRTKLGKFAMVLTLWGANGTVRNRALVDRRDALGLALGICTKCPDAFSARKPLDWSREECFAVLDTGKQLLAGPRLSDNASPAARLFFETPPSAWSIAWNHNDEDRMNIKRNRQLLCLDEIRRWISAALPPDRRIRLEW